MSQATLLGNTLHGAAQSLDRLLAQGGISGEAATRLLVDVEASLAQASILTLGYEQVTGMKLPLGSWIGDYALTIRMVREDIGRGNTPTPETVAALADLQSDLDLLVKACRSETLLRGKQRAIEKLFADAAAQRKAAQ